MRKLIDALALTGFALSASLTAALVISYYQFDSIKKQAVEDLTGQITDAVTDKLNSQLEGQVEKALPKIPTTTGPALPC